jgi:hypothetical protein
LAFLSSALFVQTPSFANLETILSDQSLSSGGPSIALIISGVIGATFFIGADVIGLGFMKKRQKTPQRSDDQSSLSDAQFVGGTSQITVAEALLSCHNSITSEGAASTINSFGTTSVPGGSPKVLTFPLI